VPEFAPETVLRYHAAGWWDNLTIADMVAANVDAQPDGLAFIAPDAVLTWREYDDLSTRLAASYVESGWRRGDRLAVLLPGGAHTHVAYLAAQKAGLVTVGLGPRAGDAEIAHILRHTGATALLTRDSHRGRPGAQIASAVGAPDHVVLDLAGTPPIDRARDIVAERGLGADDLFFVNSTSGTTGLPKCVRQTMNVRKVFAPLAADAAGGAAGFGADAVMASVLPSPYGFGLWSQHITPTWYRFPTVLVDEFDAGHTLRLIQEHRVTVLAAVTSQFIMMLNSPEFERVDLSCLRCLFTGGERVPPARAAEFEERTGAVVLQFYGSNEAGPVSLTRASDPREKRLTTAGRPVRSAEVRLVPPAGVVAVRGAGIGPGYYRDDAANAALFAEDGWMLTGDLGQVDADGYLSITGRTADFIIRGGYNISALVLEEAVGRHPRVAQVAVVGVPDEVMGERVCAFLVTRDGVDVELDELRAHLDAAGLTKHTWPERLVRMDALPMGTGAKVDKAALRADARQRFGAPA
jgi:acyl-CoA synthetase